jgi:hypothetical protein
MDWKCGLSGRASALQTQSPEFKLQSNPEKYYELIRELL